MLLRELASQDFAALHEIERDPHVTRYLPYDPHTPADTRKRIARATRFSRENPRTVFDLALTLRNSRELIGRCGLGLRGEHREAMIWYLLHPAHTGHGYAREAAAALLGLAFTRLRLHRVYADCDPRNTPSCRVARALGMKFEGRFRQNYFLKDEWCDTFIYAILAPEWPAPPSGKPRRAHQR